MSRIIDLMVAGRSMPCICFGTGDKVLVIIAGMSTTGIRTFGFSAVGSYQMFAQEYTVYLMERVDHPPEGYTTDDMARDIAEAMDQLGLRNADVFGVSQGGMIAQLLAARRPELVHSLVLGSTLCRPNPVAVETMETWLRYALAQDCRSLYREFFCRVYSPAFCEKNRKALTNMERFADAGQCDRFAVLAAAAQDFDSTSELKNITCPVLVIGDWQDRVLSGEASKELAEKLGCQLYMYDAYSHAVYDEAPDYRQRLLDFFHQNL